MRNSLVFLSFRAGDAIAVLDDVTFLATPPLSVLLDHQLVETSQTTSDGIHKREAHLVQTLFSTLCAVSDSSLILYPLDVRIKLNSPTSGKLESRGVLCPRCSCLPLTLRISIHSACPNELHAECFSISTIGEC